MNGFSKCILGSLLLSCISCQRPQQTADVSEGLPTESEPKVYLQQSGNSSGELMLVVSVPTTVSNVAICKLPKANGVVPVTKECPAGAEQTTLSAKPSHDNRNFFQTAIQPGQGDFAFAILTKDATTLRILKGFALVPKQISLAFETDIQPIVKASCMGGPCHGDGVTGGQQPPMFTPLQFNAVKQKIKFRLEERSMPMKPREISEQDRAKLLQFANLP